MLSYLEKIDAVSIKWIEDTLATEPDITRTQLANRCCLRFDWRSPYGRHQKTGSALALGRLEKLSLIDLPRVREITCNDSARRKEIDPFPARPELRCTLPELGEIQLVMTNGDSELWRLWQSMVTTWHPLKNSWLCGARICYLLKSSTAGLIGAIAFSSPAWRLAARDCWIGWSDKVRADNLVMVVNNSRFLILPQVRVPHLASHVLAKACRQVAGDWEKIYGIRPVLLETFVDPRQYRGTCYRAAGGINLGRTSGRGRQDTGDKSLAKDVYCLPLRTNFRQVLGGKKPGPLDWTEEEFGHVELGDRRLKKRLFQLAQAFYENPGANIPQACGTRAATKAAYRFFKHPAVQLKETLTGHYQATAKRIRERSRMVQMQGGNDVDYPGAISTS